ncbi:hypothetical protein DOT_4533 [Desulfosporosinus sp. OT]|nr:hypothetical protein DOT_4533 [Desulfosporosinus sp. OT]
MFQNIIIRQFIVEDLLIIFSRMKDIFFQACFLYAKSILG